MYIHEGSRIVVRIFNVRKSPWFSGVIVQWNVDVPDGSIAGEHFTDVINTR